MGWTTTEVEIEYLCGRIAILRQVIEGVLEGAPEFADESLIGCFLDEQERLLAASFGDDWTPALYSLLHRFHLSQEEVRLLLLVAGPELDPEFAELIERSSLGCGTSVTIQFAIAVLPTFDWNYLSPGGTLRSWNLIELGQGAGLMSSPIRISERILMFLCGVDQLDERLMRTADLLVDDFQTTDAQSLVAEAIAAVWREDHSFRRLPLIALSGNSPTVARSIAAAACLVSERSIWELHANALRVESSDVDQLATLWERESILSGYVLFLSFDADLDSRGGPALISNLQEFLDRYRGPLILSCRHRLPTIRDAVSFPVPDSLPEDRELMWYFELGWDAPDHEEFIARLAYAFDLSWQEVRSVVSRVRTQVLVEDSEGDFSPLSLQPRLWKACQELGTVELSRLATRLDAEGTWNDLVLPHDELQALRDLERCARARHALQRRLRLEASESSRGSGLLALFHGESGTGKTRASEVLASKLGLALYRIDLNRVVSSFIGETEKNLERLFQRAESSGAMLLFDEADALFGRRTAVRDGHDRYANQGVSFLLQRLESYTGIGILTTNMRESIDSAFRRRFFIEIAFPFPDVEARRDIWERFMVHFGHDSGLTARSLAQMSLSGGSIRNVATGAALLAEAASARMGAQEILIAAEREYAKLGQSFPREWPFLEG